MMYGSGGYICKEQMDAVNKLRDGCILCGGVGSGKSRTSLYYYFKEFGGSYDGETYKPMKNPKRLYIITTPKKRDSKEWEGEMIPLRLTIDGDNPYKMEVIVDSWNNIQKYINVYDCFFIFDEDKITGYGAWAKAFIKITNKNRWIILSATPGDKWMDYATIFIANRFFKNKTDFKNQHVIESYWSGYPKIEGYRDVDTLTKLRDSLLVDIDIKRNTVRNVIDIPVGYDVAKYKKATKDLWDPYKDEPIPSASSLCYVQRRIVNEDESRCIKLLEIMEDNPKIIVFYNFDYELDILRDLCENYKKSHRGFDYAEWNGHYHQDIPNTKSWVYLSQYTSGCEGWNCIKTDTMVFYSQNYSYKVVEQAQGRTDRMNTPFTNLYYYNFKSSAWIDVKIAKALKEKKIFNERDYGDSISRFANNS